MSFCISAKNLYTYSLHFPEDKTHGNVHLVNDDARNDGRENRQTPLVVIFGGAGCAGKYLIKYRDIYSTLGCITLVVALPCQALLYQSFKVPEVIQQLLAILAQNGITHNPVIAHVFSNAGCLMYSRFSAALHDSRRGRPGHGPHGQGLRLCLKGVVLDSGPSRWSVRMGVQSAMIVANGSPLLQRALGLMMPLALNLLSLLPKVMLPLGINNWYDLYDDISHDRARCPQLFLYSRADEIVPAADVAELVEARRRRGLRVKQVVWDDSPHVRHFTMHPEVYTDTCRHFAHACLAAASGAAVSPRACLNLQACLTSLARQNSQASVTSLALQNSQACVTSRARHNWQACLTSRNCLTSWGCPPSRKCVAGHASRLASRL